MKETIKNLTKNLGYDVEIVDTLVINVDVDGNLINSDYSGVTYTNILNEMTLVGEYTLFDVFEQHREKKLYIYLQDGMFVKETDGVSRLYIYIQKEN